MRRDSHYYITQRNYSNTSRRTVRSSRRRIMNPMALIIAAFAIVICLTFSIRTVSASGKEDRTVYKYYTSITVQSDDTLWDIASRYSDEENNSSYVKNVMSINNMSDSTIYSGQNLIIYYYSEELK